jgi:hypothetical protein
MWLEGLYWIDMAQGRDWWLATVNMVMNVDKVQHQLVAQLFYLLMP